MVGKQVQKGQQRGDWRLPSLRLHSLFKKIPCFDVNHF